MTPTDLVDQDSLRNDVPEFRPGDTLKVHVRVVEGNKERVQVFQGVVTRRQRAGLTETFTVRKVSSGIGVERTFPLHAPTISKIEKVSSGRVRRAKLYYLRDRVGKAAKVRQKRHEREVTATSSTTTPVPADTKSNTDVVESSSAVVDGVDE